MNLIIAGRTGRTEAELLATIGAGELRRWYGHLMLELDEQAAWAKAMRGG